MLEKSKNIFEDSKEGTIGARIRVLLAETQLSVTKLEEKGGVGNGTLKTWKSNTLDFSSNVLKSFKEKLGINEAWWKSGEGEVFITPASKSTDSNQSEKKAEDVYRDWLESKTDYLLIPKTVLSGEYRMMLNSEIESKEKMLWQVIEAKNYAIAQLEKEIAELRAGAGKRAIHPQNA
jgi:hypothetical protein